MKHLFFLRHSITSDNFVIKIFPKSLSIVICRLYKLETFRSVCWQGRGRSENRYTNSVSNAVDFVAMLATHRKETLVALVKDDILENQNKRKNK